MMVIRAGLTIGAAFAELSASSSNSSYIHKRWHLARLSLADGIKAFLAEHALENVHLRVATQMAQWVVERRHGGPVAWLGTAGFESWLSALVYNHAPTLNPLVHSDFIFGVRERINARGEVETPVALEEIEFLAAKLQMSQIRDIGVGFLHAHRNPSHEEIVCNYLRERGFRVHPSSTHRHCPGGEGARWMLALLDSYVSNEWQQLQEQLNEIAAQCPAIAKLDLEGGPSPYLSQNAWAEAMTAAHPQRMVHLGLERFVRLEPKQKPERMRVQPTQLIASGCWQTPELSTLESGYQPGPMAFGKSLAPTLLDAIYLRRSAELSPLFGELLQERALRRIEEALLTEARRQGQSASIDARHVAELIEDLTMTKLCAEIAAYGFKGDLMVAGPFAPLLFDSLKKRLPDLRITLGEDFSASMALSQKVSL